MGYVPAPGGSTAGTGLATPSVYGWQAWNIPLPLVTSNSQLTPGGAGVLALKRVEIPTPSAGLTFTNLIVGVSVSAVAPSNSFVGVYRPNGLLVAQTPDQTASWATVGYKVMGAPGVVPAGDAFCWVAILVGAFTTTPSFIGQGAGITLGINGTLAAQLSEVGEYGTGLTALPASIVPANIVQPVGPKMIWVALS